MFTKTCNYCTSDDTNATKLFYVHKLTCIVLYENASISKMSLVVEVDLGLPVEQDKCMCVSGEQL